MLVNWGMMFPKMAHNGLGLAEGQVIELQHFKISTNAE
jgi:hypothetical protein